MKAITTREATVKTLAVQIKTLTVGARQMTLSIFRQVHEEPILNPETLEFRGVPWGRVNYRWGSCADAGQDHLHVVWLKGDELRRCCVEPRPSLQEGVRIRLDEMDEVLSTLVRIGFLSAGLHGETGSLDGYNHGTARLGPWSIRTPDDDVKAVNCFWRERDRFNDSFCTPSRDFSDSPRDVFGRPRSGGVDAARADLVNRIRLYIKHWALPDGPEFRDDDPGFPERVHREYRDEYRSREAYRSLFVQRYSELAQLDHLFIAV